MMYSANRKIKSAIFLFFIAFALFYACKKETAVSGVPYLVTATPQFVTSNNASVGGIVTSDGGAPVTQKGICFGVMPEPDINASVINANAGTGGFEVDLVGLIPSTKYFARAFAQNKNGIAYGNIVSFTTTATNTTITPPSVNTNNVVAITSFNAICGGNVINDGGGLVSTRGICWSTQNNPDLSDSYLTNGNGIGNYNITIPGLSPSTTYYVRAFASNDAGTAFGQVRTFTTQEANDDSYFADNSCDPIITLEAENAICTEYEISLTGATPSNIPLSFPACYNGGPTINDVWLKVSAPASTVLTLATYATGPVDDVVMAVYSSVVFCDVLTQVSCVDDIQLGGGVTERMPYINLNASGETYYIRIWGWDPGVSGTFLFCASYE